MVIMNCDSCLHYHWYYDYCDMWKCKVDGRAAYQCFKPFQDCKEDDKQKLKDIGDTKNIKTEGELS